FAVAVYVLQHFGINTIPLQYADIAASVFLVLLIIHLIGRAKVVPAAKMVAGNLIKAYRWLDACPAKAELHFQQEQQRIVREYEKTTEALNREWKTVVKTAIDQRGAKPTELDEKARRLYQKNENVHRLRLERIEHDGRDAAAFLEKESEVEAKKLEDTYATKMAQLNADHQARWASLQSEWKNQVEPIYQTIHAANASAEKLFPLWEIERWKEWAPPEEFKNAAKFGCLEVDVGKFLEVLPKDERLTRSIPSTLSVPLSLVYPQQGSILFEAAKTGNDDAIRTINNAIFRLLSTTPPGKLNLTIFDPVGLGQNFAGLMHLADYEESHINSRIWTQSGQFEEKLAELNEHMEKVIQMYLRNEYATITEYNAQAGAIAEKYHILVIASFPVNFSDVAARRLRNIATSGARCGVYTLIHWDQRNTVPADFVP
ncbi:MAG TPA: ATP-binding protein, partial [Verrucomicrobiae bacterium]|nr:ATP-binding protein [Verrucomicrobiae bacterium]